MIKSPELNAEIALGKIQSLSNRPSPLNTLRVRQEIRAVADGVFFGAFKSDATLQVLGRWSGMARGITGSLETYGHTLSTFLDSIQKAKSVPQKFPPLDAVERSTDEMFDKIGAADWDKQYTAVSDTYARVLVDDTKARYHEATELYLLRSSQDTIDGQYLSQPGNPLIQTRRHRASIMASVLQIFDTQNRPFELFKDIQKNNAQSGLQ